MTYLRTRIGLSAVAIFIFVSFLTAQSALAGDAPYQSCLDDSVCDDGSRCTDDHCQVFEDEVCGDPNASGDVTAVDALHVLRSATGLESMCRPVICDVDSNGTVTATDALRVLQSAVGIAAGVLCQGECVHVPVECGDGNACNGEEICDPIDGCSAGAEVDCDDQDLCTDDMCDDSDGCVHEPIDCDDGNTCNGDEFCMSDFGCMVAAPQNCDDQNACTTDSCDDSDGCAHEPIDCSDDDVCNGEERCDSEQGCLAGDARDCDDGDACTMDSCSDDGGCTHDPVNCNDGDLCNGEEQCDAELGCVAGLGLDCNDRDFCNGEETCDAELGCVDADAPDCSDGDECTVDECDEETDECRHKGQAGAGSDVISFSALAAGSIVEEVFGDGGAGPVSVYATNGHLLEMNAAVVYDSSCTDGCSGKGRDLGTPNETFDGPGAGAGGEAGAVFENATAQGQILIVAKDLIDEDPEDGLVDDPRDQGDRQPVSAHFDFSAIGSVAIESIKVMDVDGEEDLAVIDIYGDDEALLTSVVSPATGDNGVAIIDLGSVEGAVEMVVSLFGSGAIDDIVFSSGVCVDPEPSTTTTSTTSTTTIHENPTLVW
jgi:hypothetical protein